MMKIYLFTIAPQLLYFVGFVTIVFQRCTFWDVQEFGAIWTILLYQSRCFFSYKFYVTMLRVCHDDTFVVPSYFGQSFLGPKISLTLNFCGPSNYGPLISWPSIIMLPCKMRMSLSSNVYIYSTLFFALHNFNYFVFYICHFYMSMFFMIDFLLLNRFSHLTL